MKILFFFTYSRGLLSTFYQELCARLQLDGYDVHCFFFKHDEQIFVEQNVNYYSKKKRNRLINYFNIFKIINRLKPDIIISNFSYANPAVLFGKLLRIKNNLVWFHTVYNHSRPSKIKQYNKKIHLRLADYIITNSPLLQQEMKEYYGIKISKTFSLPFWTDIHNIDYNEDSTYYNKTEKTINIGCPGRLVEDKNHAIVFEALKNLENNKNYHLFIAGDGNYKGELMALASRLNILSQITFLGLLTKEKMVHFYKNMDLVVLPSLNEAFGLVFIETISLGVPVIVSNAFGALGHVSNKYQTEKFTFNPRNSYELKSLIEDFENENFYSGEYFKMLYTNNFDKSKIYFKFKNFIDEL